ncbi:unnamed protein product, partial [Prorocentrum cordatum]
MSLMLRAWPREAAAPAGRPLEAGPAAASLLPHRSDEEDRGPCPAARGVAVAPGTTTAPSGRHLARLAAGLAAAALAATAPAAVRVCWSGLGPRSRAAVPLWGPEAGGQTSRLQELDAVPAAVLSSNPGAAVVDASAGALSSNPGAAVVGASASLLDSSATSLGGSLGGLATAGSCAALGCGEFDRGRPCQCNQQCLRHSNCCSDYDTACAAASPPPSGQVPLAAPLGGTAAAVAQSAPPTRAEAEQMAASMAASSPAAPLGDTAAAVAQSAPPTQAEAEEKEERTAAPMAAPLPGRPSAAAPAPPPPAAAEAGLASGGNATEAWACYAYDSTSGESDEWCRAVGTAQDDGWEYRLVASARLGVKASGLECGSGCNCCRRRVGEQAGGVPSSSNSSGSAATSGVPSISSGAAAATGATPFTTASTAGGAAAGAAAPSAGEGLADGSRLASPAYAVAAEPAAEPAGPTGSLGNGPPTGALSSSQGGAAVVPFGGGILDDMSVSEHGSLDSLPSLNDGAWGDDGTGGVEGLALCEVPRSGNAGPRAV